MSVPNEYKVSHKNNKKDFLIKTFSGFKKNDSPRKLKHSIRIDFAITDVG